MQEMKNEIIIYKFGISDNLDGYWITRPCDGNKDVST